MMLVMKWHFLAIIIFSNHCTGETSSLVCTSSLDIKNCIYENQDRISKLVDTHKEKNSELRRLADMLTSERHEKAAMIQNFNSSLFEFETTLQTSKISHKQDIQNIKVDIDSLIEADDERTKRIQNQLRLQSHQLDILNQNIINLQAGDEYAKTSLLEYSESINLKIISNENTCKNTLNEIDRKVINMMESAKTEAQLVETWLNNSDSTLRMVQGQLHLLEDAINDEKNRRNNDLQKLLELSQRTDDTTLASPMDKLDSKVMKNKAEIQVLKVRIDEIETKSKKEKEDEKSKDVIVVEQLPNDQNALDTLKSRIDKIQYEVVKVDNQVSRDKANTMKTIMHLTNWIKEVLSGMRIELDSQQEVIANLTTAVVAKDIVIEKLENDVLKSMADSTKLRNKLFDSDLDRDLRLARLELAVEGSGEKHVLKDKIIELEKWKESTSKIIDSLLINIPDLE